MTEIEATAEVFWTAFQVLGREEKQEVLRRLIKNKTLRRELIDLAIIEERRNEPSRPLNDYLQELRD